MDGEGAARLDGLLCACNARLGIHQTYPVWPVSLVPHVPHVSRQRNYARSKGQPWPLL